MPNRRFSMSRKKNINNKNIKPKKVLYSANEEKFINEMAFALASIAKALTK